MQDADVKALAWAVRRELDICLTDLSNTSDTEGWGPHLEQVRVRLLLPHKTGCITRSINVTKPLLQNFCRLQKLAARTATPT